MSALSEYLRTILILAGLVMVVTVPFVLEEHFPPASWEMVSPPEGYGALLVKTNDYPLSPTREVRFYFYGHLGEDNYSQVFREGEQVSNLQEMMLETRLSELRHQARLEAVR